MNLETKTLSIADRNLKKTLCGFLECDVTQPVTFKTVERLASWSSRYALVAPILRPFTRFLYENINGRTCRQATFMLSETAVTAVLLWRATLIALCLNAGRVALPLKTLVALDRMEDSVCWQMGFDGAPVGAGFSVFNEQGQLQGWGSYLFPYSLKHPESDKYDSKYQNATELIGAVMLLLWLQRAGGGYRVKITGDSRVVVQWLLHHRVKSILARRASVALSILHTSCSHRVESVKHIPAAENQFNDDLSRGGVNLQHLPQAQRFQSDETTHLIAVLNPMLELETEEALLSFMGVVLQILR